MTTGIIIGFIIALGFYGAVNSVREYRAHREHMRRMEIIAALRRVTQREAFRQAFMPTNGKVKTRGRINDVRKM